MFELIVISAGFLIIVAAILGLTIGIAAKVFEVKQDERVEKVMDELPGANCGGCGLAGCSDFAKAVVAGSATPAQCPVCPSESVNKILKIMGLESSGDKEKSVAIVLCRGGKSKAKYNSGYNGINDCKSSVLISGGSKGCKDGCLGLGTCARVCPFDAIEITDDQLAYVHPDLCVGCGKCIETCPRKLIKMVPESAHVHIYCNSKEKGPVKKKVCSVSCIGCRKCVKSAEDGQITMDGFLAKINYENPPANQVVENAACPTGCLR